MHNELSDSKLLLESVINTAIDGIITMDASGIIKMLNPAAASLFGYTRDELLNQNISILMNPPEAHEHDGYVKRYLAGGKPHIIGIGRVVTGKKKDGSTFPLRLAVSEVRTQKELLFTGVVHDLTEVHEVKRKIEILNKSLQDKVEERTHKLKEVVNRLLETNSRLEEEIVEKETFQRQLMKREQELKESLDKEKELGTLKSRFMSMASHEFKTPLSTIHSSAALLGKYIEMGNVEKGRKHVKRIKKTVDHLNGVLNDFLSVDRLEEGKLSFHIKEIDLSGLLIEMADEMKNILKEDQRFDLEYVREDLQIQSDELILRNIFYNLFSNAIKYSKEQSVVTVRTKQLDNKISIEVEDQGIGIPKEEQSRLFSRFFRASNASHVPGTGLGLAIVQKYVHLMRGEVEYTDKKGKGSLFKVTLPNSF